MPEAYEKHYRFLRTEFVPGMRDLGIYMTDVWQTLWGEYPLRIAEFVAESLETVRRGLESDAFKALEEKFLAYTVDYQRRVIPYRRGFQL